MSGIFFKLGTQEVSSLEFLYLAWPFQPSLMFVGKARSKCLNSGLTNIRPGANEKFTAIKILQFTAVKILKFTAVKILKFTTIKILKFTAMKIVTFTAVNILKFTALKSLKFTLLVGKLYLQFTEVNVW